ncbi:MAG: hypothetical protein R3359_10975 [Marinirhabdus sp.]|nr:hypothetical protein [Marinirhabdus sp.]
MKSIQDCEARKIDKLLNFRLPHYAKKIGWILCLLSLGTILSLKFIDGDWTILKVILKRLILVSLFIVVLAREKVEDERLQHIRAKTFSLTFLFSAIYILIQPVINTIVGSILGKEQDVFQDLGDFVILWFMLVVYLTFFHFAKKRD